MRTISKLWLGCLAAQLLAARALAEPPAALTLVSEDGKETALTLEQLSALPQVEIRVADPNGPEVAFRGPSLHELAIRAGAPAGDALRGRAMTLALLAQAPDGYRVAYTLAELDPSFGARNAIVALTQDGHPLSAHDGPLRVVVEGDQHRARWIRQLSELRLVHVGTP
ncbi:MAG TPA: molybdopterin-binding protein [Myxococcota bacterium]|nr:molybdopterin-binding protein [Myxococcota bacterium]